MRQCLRERAHGAAIPGAVNDKNRDLLEPSGDGLLDATLPGVDDETVAAIRFGGNDGRLHDADRLDRGEQQGVGLGIGL